MSATEQLVSSDIPNFHFVFLFDVDVKLHGKAERLAWATLLHHAILKFLKVQKFVTPN